MDYLERIAILETEYEQMKEDIHSMNAKLDLLVESSNKMKGFWAGAIAAGTALGAALGALISYIFHAKVGS